MSFQIKKAAVIGAGVMGSGIAAHLANVGIPTLLLDIVPQELTPDEKMQGLQEKDPQFRNRFATLAVQKLLKQKPAAFTTKSNLSLITTGNIEDDLSKIADVDWVIEVVVENLEVKRTLYEKIDQVRKKGTIVSSNTSGISVEAMAEGRSQDFQKHFLGTHFFNPPRYLKLLEIIPTKQTDPSVTHYMKLFSENILGKGVVLAKDTPNFIANRIGTYGLLVTAKEMLDSGLSIGEVDSITGTLIGRPKSATFRTLDLVGLDTFMLVANNAFEHVTGEEKSVFEIPSFMKEMHRRGLLGSKSGQGFYKKTGKEIFELNYKTMEYEKQKRLKTPGHELIRQAKGTKAKMKMLVFSEDKAGVFLWNIIAPVLILSAQLKGEIADDIVAIDNAMKWGFGWKLGPFETWDALGVEATVQKMEAEGHPVPSWVKNMLNDGHTSFYREENGDILFYEKHEYKKQTKNNRNIDLQQLKKAGKLIKQNHGASLIDLEDGVALLEFHSPNNAIGLDIIQMLNDAIDEVERNYKGLVIGNQGKNFCVGANLALILMAAQDDDLFEVDMVVRQFQQAMMRIKYSKKPVVAAPFGMTLGGGAEVCLPADYIQAAMETYIGLVETGVGLIPGGGGNKELYLKTLDQMAKGIDVDLQKVANKVFETIAMAHVSSSAEEARENNFLSSVDGISINQDHLIYDAKQAVLRLHEQGYKPPLRKKIPVTGETGYATLLIGAEAMRLSGYISDYDMNIAKKLAYVIAGGKVPYGTEVDEQYLLDLEREAFLSLVVELKTQQRMQHMLLKGKPLRN